MEFEKETKNEEVCPECKGTGMVREQNGLVHTCWKCLSEGKLDVHSKKLPDTKIKL